MDEGRGRHHLKAGKIYILVFLACALQLTSCGPDTAVNTTVAQYILSPDDLPAYEQSVDHASLINMGSEEFYHKGMITYRKACYSCHGDLHQPGSIPNSRQFWKEAFKNGSDPYSLYQTITRGFGLMPPQVQLTPKEKYEVIHFIREEFLKEENPEAYFTVTESWIEGLPKGDTLGPPPTDYAPWAEMDYGNVLMRTYEMANSNDPPRQISGGRSPLPNEDLRQQNFTYKGIAMRLDPGKGGIAAGRVFALFDHDLLRFSGFWTGDGFIDWEDILLNDVHNIYPRTVGEIQMETAVVPGWAHPETGTMDDPRFTAVDGRKFGPLPRDWGHYKGLYRFNEQAIIHYTIGASNIWELYTLEKEGINPIISRTINLKNIVKPLRCHIGPNNMHVSITGDGMLVDENGNYYIDFPAGNSAQVKIYLGNKSSDMESIEGTRPRDLSSLLRGGNAQYPEVLTSEIVQNPGEGAYTVDVLTLPFENIWKSRFRPTGIDFLENGDQALICTIDGEVYRVEGITQTEGQLKWHRIATGLFQPLGIKYHQGEIYVSCRDQIVKLHDLNRDGETDYYQSFNSDHQVTEHFHEFAMGLQVDDAGNFYYAKSGRHARDALVPQHGTLIRVSPDGSTSEIIAHGFRAANGVCLNPDGSFIVTDQEGYWNPMNRINWVEEGGFYGNMYGYGAPPDTSDDAMIQPLCWIDSRYDRSPAELLWAHSDRWGPLNGALLNLSYGYGKIYVVMPQLTSQGRQGSMVELPVPQFPTGIMRGRFNPLDGQLYVCGMSAWATNQMIQVGGLYRVRYSGQELTIPTQTTFHQDEIRMTFATSLEPASAENPINYEINVWDLKRTHNYGSKRYNIKTLVIDDIELRNQKEVILFIKDLSPTWIIEIKYDVQSLDGLKVSGAVQGTIYALDEKENL